jgi:hypothetical protein
MVDVLEGDLFGPRPPKPTDARVERLLVEIASLLEERKHLLANLTAAQERGSGLLEYAREGRRLVQDLREVLCCADAAPTEDDPEFIATATDELVDWATRPL